MFNKLNGYIYNNSNNPDMNLLTDIYTPFQYIEKNHLYIEKEYGIEKIMMKKKI